MENKVDDNNKTNNGIEYINRKMNGGKMIRREVANRINFLLNGLRILDRIKKDGKKRNRCVKKNKLNGKNEEIKELLKFDILIREKFK
jgi:hypothetical protein